MRKKKSAGKVFGSFLSKSESKAMDMEIQRQLAEYDKKHLMEIDAMILWILHEKFGFGPGRLKKFYDSFADSVWDLVKRYEMEDSDQIWLCTHKLEEYGIDLEEWRKEH